MYPFRKSSLDALRKLEEPAYIDGEELIQREQASYDVGGAFSSSWKLGRLCLTEKSVCFEQAGRIIFKIPLSRIHEVSVLERPWILGKMIKQLCIIPKAGAGKRAYYIGVSKPDEWEIKISSMTDNLISNMVME